MRNKVIFGTGTHARVPYAARSALEQGEGGREQTEVTKERTQHYTLAH